MSAEDLYGLLVPLLDERLLVPRACIAEVTGFQPLSEMPGAPPWYLNFRPSSQFLLNLYPKINDSRWRLSQALAISFPSRPL